MKIVFNILIFLSIALTVNAQKIEFKEVDKFTKNKIVETSMEKLYTKNPMAMGYSNFFSCAIRKVDDDYSMPATILMDDIVKYDENSGVTFLLSNDETVTLRTNYTGIGGEKFGQGYLFNTSFSLSKLDVNLLKHNNIVSVRISYMGGHFDYDIKSKKQDIVAKMFELVDKE